jgi:phosphoribosylglycinamide formyltransferase 1
MMESTSPPVPRIGVLASGRGSNLQALLDAEADGNLHARIATVISDREEAVALDRARQRGIPAVFLDPGSPRARLQPGVERTLVETLRGHGADWVVLAGYLRIIGGELLEAFPLRVLNIHPSLLPSFPGLRAPAQAIAHGVRVAGCTVHLVSTEVDAGPILRQAAVPVFPDDTEETLAARILEQEHRILVEAVNDVATRRFRVVGRTVRWEGNPSPPPPVQRTWGGDAI